MELPKHMPLDGQVRVGNVPKRNHTCGIHVHDMLMAGLFVVKNTLETWWAAWAGLRTLGRFTQEKTPRVPTWENLKHNVERKSKRYGGVKV